MVIPADVVGAGAPSTSDSPGGGFLGHLGAFATAAPYFSSGPMTASSASSSESAWLPVSTGDWSGERLSAGLEVPAAGDGDVLFDILDIL